MTYLTFLERLPDRFASAVLAVAGCDGGTVLVHCAGGVEDADLERVRARLR